MRRTKLPILFIIIAISMSKETDGQNIEVMNRFGKTIVLWTRLNSQVRWNSIRIQNNYSGPVAFHPPGEYEVVARLDGLHDEYLDTVDSTNLPTRLPPNTIVYIGGVTKQVSRMVRETQYNTEHYTREVIVQRPVTETAYREEMIFDMQLQSYIKYIVPIQTIRIVQERRQETAKRIVPTIVQRTQMEEVTVPKLLVEIDGHVMTIQDLLRDTATQADATD